MPMEEPIPAASIKTVVNDKLVHGTSSSSLVRLWVAAAQPAMAREQISTTDTAQTTAGRLGHA